MRYLLRAAETLHRVSAHEIPSNRFPVVTADLTQRAFDHRRHDRTGRHRIDSDTELSILDARVPRQTDDSMLACGIPSLIASPAHAANRGGIDDRPPPLAVHYLQDVLHTEEHAVQIDR